MSLMSKCSSYFLVLCLTSCFMGCSGAGQSVSGKAGEAFRGLYPPEVSFQKEQEAAGREQAMAGEDQEAAREEQKIQSFLASMTLEEKVAQMFVVLPEALVEGTWNVTAAGSETEAALDEIPVGGVIYMENNLQSREQVKEMLSNVQAYSMERIGLPAFLCVDEEGGTVARIGKSGRFDVPVIPDMAVIGQEGSREAASEAGNEIGAYLSELGFNVDFAPVADVWSNPENTVVSRRSFGSDPQKTAELALAVAEGLEAHGILSAYKHFPGHGATVGDTHDGYAYTDKTLEELRECEWIPFQDGVNHQIPIIMVGHISLPKVTGDDTPSSLSYRIITELLREELGHDGLVVTDALNMKAIVQQYSSAEAAVMTIEAGTDLLLMPKDFRAAYEGVLKAIAEGRLSRERIDRSVERILRAKLRLMPDREI